MDEIERNDDGSQMEDSLADCTKPEFDVAGVVTEQVRLLQLRFEEKMQQFAAITREELNSFGESVQNFLDMDEDSVGSSAEASVSKTSQSSNEDLLKCYVYVAEIFRRSLNLNIDG